MSESTPWRELHRTSDLRETVAVVTSIASMEFEVRCTTLDGSVVGLHELERAGGLIVIEVPEQHHRELLDVLDDIVLEQQEFDARLEGEGPWTWKRVMLSLAAMSGIGVLLWLILMPRG